jgi:hypothetical protein
MPREDTTFTKLKQLRDMGLIILEIHPSKNVGPHALIEMLQAQGFIRIANILKKEMRDEISADHELEEMAR